MNRFLLIAVFTISFLFFLANGIPASQLHRLLGDHAGLQLSGLNGSLWSGSAKQFQFRTLQANDLTWSFNVLPLLLASLSADLAIQDPALELQGTLAKSLSGALSISDLTGKISLVQIASQLPNPLIAQTIHGGTATLAIEEMEFDQGLISYVDGTLQLDDVQIAVPNPISLGSLAIQLSNNEQGIIANIQDQGKGALTLQAQATLLADGKYSLRGLVGTKDPKAVDLQNMLRLLGKPDAEGRFAINFTGRL